MEFEIKIVHSPLDSSYPYAAWTVVNGKDIVTHGNTSEQAEERMIERLKSLKPQEPTLKKIITI